MFNFLSDKKYWVPRHYFIGEKKNWLMEATNDGNLTSSKVSYVLTACSCSGTPTSISEGRINLGTVNKFNGQLMVLQPPSYILEVN